MKTILRIEFDNMLFYPEYTGDRNIVIENPHHIPQTGDLIDFNIGDFFDDAKVINRFEKVSENTMLYAERLLTKYSKDQTEILIVVYEEQIFKEYFPQFFLSENK